MALAVLHSVKVKVPKTLIAALKNENWISPQRWNILYEEDWIIYIPIYRTPKSFNIYIVKCQNPLQQ